MADPFLGENQDAGIQFSSRRGGRSVKEQH